MTLDGGTYAGHDHGSAEASPDTVVDTLRLAPAGVDALEPVTLVTGEALRACTTRPVNISIRSELPNASPPSPVIQSPRRLVGKREEEEQFLLRGIVDRGGAQG